MQPLIILRTLKMLIYELNINVSQRLSCSFALFLFLLTFMLSYLLTWNARLSVIISQECKGTPYTSLPKLILSIKNHRKVHGHAKKKNSNARRLTCSLITINNMPCKKLPAKMSVKNDFQKIIHRVSMVSIQN